MTGWRDRLAAIRARHAGADSSPAGAIGTIGTNDNGPETENGGDVLPAAAPLPPPNGTIGTNGNGMEMPKRAAPLPPAWPPGFLYLSGLAVRLDVALRDGAAVERCPSGALDVTLPDGRLWFLTPSTVARLAAAGLLPPHLAERVPDPIEEAERVALAGDEGEPHPYRPATRTLCGRGCCAAGVTTGRGPPDGAGSHRRARRGGISRGLRARARTAPKIPGDDTPAPLVPLTGRQNRVPPGGGASIPAASPPPTVRVHRVRRREMERKRPLPVRPPVPISRRCR